MQTTNIKQAVAYMGIYVVTHSIVLSVIGHLSNDLSTSTLFFFRNLVGLVFILPLIAKRKTALFKTAHLSFHFVRGFAALIGGYSIFYALSTLPLTLVVAISFSAPIFASLLACLLFREEMTKAKVIATSLGFLGVVILLRPSFNSHFYGVLAALVAAIMAAIAFVTVKKLTNHDSNDTITSFPFVLILPFSTISAIVDWTAPTESQIPLLLLIGAGFSASQYAMVRAFSLAEASILLPIDFSRLIIVSIISTLFLNVDIDAWTLVGGTVILIGSLQIFIIKSDT